MGKPSKPRKRFEIIGSNQPTKPTSAQHTQYRSLAVLGAVLLASAGCCWWHQWAGSTTAQIPSSGTERRLLFTLKEGEGFNGQRMIAQKAFMLEKQLQRRWKLVLPPFTFPHGDEPPRPWGDLFDRKALLDYAVVEELLEEAQPIVVDLVVFVDKVKGHGQKPGKIECPTDRWNAVAAKWDHQLRVGPGGAAHLFGAQLAVRRMECWRSPGISIVEFGALLERHLNPDDSTVLVHYMDHVDWPRNEQFYRRKWELLPHLHFAPGLWALAADFRRKLFLKGGVTYARYAAAHLRRGNRNTKWPNPLTGEPKVPIGVAIAQLKHLLVESKSKTLFIATDIDSNHADMKRLRAELPIVRLSDADVLYSAVVGSEAIALDQLLCIQSEFFLGTYGSTLSQVVWEERALGGYSHTKTYNAFQLDGSNWRDVGKHYAPLPDMEATLQEKRRQLLQ